MDYNEDFKKYKKSEDVYEKFPILTNLNAEQIIGLGLMFHGTNSKHDFEFASACRALILLDREKFK